MAQMAKNPPVMQVSFLDWENHLEEEMATQLQYSCLKNPMHRGVFLKRKS